MNLYLARTLCGLQRPDGSVVRFKLEDLSDLRALNDSGAMRRRLGRRPKANVWLSGELARPFLLGPVAGIAGAGEFAALARAKAPEITGLQGPCQVQVDFLGTSAMSLVVAMRQADIEDIMGCLHKAGIGARCLRPWWTLALEALPGGEGTQVTAVDDGDAVTVLSGDDEGWSLADWHPGRQPEARNEDVVRRSAVGQGCNVQSVRRIRMSMAESNTGRPWPMALEVDSF